MHVYKDPKKRSSDTASAQLTMADIFDYLEWRGDISFSEDPFNEVDNLILAELSYAHFDGILQGGRERMRLREADRLYFAKHKRSGIREDSGHVARSPLLMDAMLSGRRFRNTVMTGYMNIIDEDKTAQIAALTYLLSDGSAYVAFRGTDSTVIGWKEDFNMSYLPETEGQRRAVAYLNEAGSRLRRPLRVGGHSKGGNFAVYASAFCDRKVQDRIINVYTNDGPGFRREVMASPEYKRILPRVVSIVPDTSVIGMLLTSRVRHKTVKSSVSGLQQHDAMTWQVSRNSFVAAEQSELGIFIKRSQQDWLSKLDDETRESFVNTLFSLFEATGMGSFGEMSGQKLVAAERILYSLRDLPKDKQRELTGILGELIHSGSRVAKTMIKQ